MQHRPDGTWVRRDPLRPAGGFAAAGADAPSRGTPFDRLVPMRKFAILLVTVSFATGCGTKDDSSGKTGGADKPAGPVKTDPKALWADFNGGVKGMDLLDKYRDGATFTGTVKNVGEEIDHDPFVAVDIDGKNIIMLKFADKAKAKVKAGDSITVTCKIGGASGAMMLADECK
jgi:hypothetical protein